ncbi:hypothetical protein V8E54_014254 [Elaphomyces granulatus]
MVIVFVYSFGVLCNNRRRLKKIVVEEERQKSERPKSVDLDETDRDDIPFGARALESGIQVEGIWISSPASLSPDQSETPATSIPPSPILPPAAQSMPANPPMYGGKRR